MLGQHGHFALYAAEKIPYAIERYRDEAARLYRVLDTQLGKTGAYVAGDYSIADIACFPWTMTHKAQGFTLDDYPNVKRWYADVRARPQVQAGLAIGKFVKEPFDEEARQEHVRRSARRRWRGGNDCRSSWRGARERASRTMRPQTDLHPSRRALARAPQDDGSRQSTKGNAMIEFFFDCSSPWTYLAFHNIQPLAKEFGAEICWRPILVGGIFNTVNPSVYARARRRCRSRRAT